MGSLFGDNGIDKEAVSSSVIEILAAVPAEYLLFGGKGVFLFASLGRCERLFFDPPLYGSVLETIYN